MCVGLGRRVVAEGRRASVKATGLLAEGVAIVVGTYAWAWVGMDEGIAFAEWCGVWRDEVVPLARTVARGLVVP